MKQPVMAFVCICLAFNSIAQTVDTSMLNNMRWRMIGPHRGGRTVGAVGVPQQPNVFYIGVNNGGVWKTTDYGRTWLPIFDSQPTGSVGDVAVAPSNPNIVYVASGEGIQRPDLSVGDGIYKSTDAGKTWINTGLKEGQQIGGLAIDATNENRVFAAVLGHPYGPNTERGVYRTMDGGKTWQRVLCKDENTGAVQVAIDPKDPNIVYADLWAGRQGPWENGEWNGDESGLYKSTDGGNTWKQLTKGLPTPKMGLGRIGFCIAPTNTNRLYATVDAGEYGGIYKSDDAGESWSQMNKDERFWGRGDDFAEVKVDPENADVVYTADVAVWKSVDGAKTWSAFRGAPGGDDYHRIWINPTNPEIILLAADQGAIITVNGGQTFSSWYNQPTAQFYHVSTDNAFPYNVYGGQQESGSVGITSRGNDGQITFHEWHPVGGEEYGYIAADPKNADIIYAGKISKYDKRTGQVQNISPEAVRSGKYRFIRTAPILFSPIDSATLYFAGNVIFKTKNGGNTWQTISPDLTREAWDIPASVGIYTNEAMKKMPRRGVVYTIAPSFKDINTIWAGTDDGYIQVTHNGGQTWANVTPPQITSWSKVSMMEASHNDVNTAYAAVNRIRCDDMHPHIYKTTDGGKSWREIVIGLPDDPINTIREDHVRKGLLFAGSEREVYFSLDNGEHWQSLRLNMPATSIRDLVIKGDDLVIGTHGRSFWILDNITPLRQLSESVVKTASILYKPQTAIRVSWNMNSDTPLPQEEPAGENPPDGAMIDYYLKENSNSAVLLEIKDIKGNIIRRYSSNDTPYTIPPVNIPLYWVRPQQILSATQGAHRFMWDMHYAPLNLPATYPIAAIYQNTAPAPTSPWVMPGVYTVTLKINDVRFTQQLTVTMDPRIHMSLKALQQQHDLAVICYQGRLKGTKINEQITVARNSLKQIQPGNNSITKNDFSWDEQLATLQGNTGIEKINRSFAGLHGILEDVQMPPTTQTIMAVAATQKQLQDLESKWTGLKNKITLAKK